MGAHARLLAALSLAVALLVHPSFAAGGHGGTVRSGAVPRPPRPTVSQKLIPRFFLPGNRPHGRFDRRDRGHGRGDDGRRFRRPQVGSPFLGGLGFYPDFYGGGYAGYGDYGLGYLPVEPPSVPLAEPAQSHSSYERFGGLLYQYDLDGRLIGVTPAPSKTWPRGGQDARDAVRTTGGYWGARLSGLQAGGYTTAKGFATFWLDESDRALHFRLDLRDIRNITSAYIYLGDPNLPTAAAPAVAPLYTGRPIGGRYTGRLGEGSMLSRDLMGWLSGHPIGSLVEAMDAGQAIVRVNTVQHPQGELEGVAVPVLPEAPRP